MKIEMKNMVIDMVNVRLGLVVGMNLKGSLWLLVVVWSVIGRKFIGIKFMVFMMNI